MNSIGLFAQHPAFRLNDSASISSSGGIIVLVAIVLTSIFVCYPFIDDIWADYKDLYVEHSLVSGTNQVIKGIQLAIAAPSS